MRDDVYSKIEWANQHITELDTIIETFKEDDPYGTGNKRDPKTGEYLVYLESAKPLPEPIRMIVGDVIHNLYSALDYLAGQLVRASGNRPTISTAFPISENAPITSKQKSRYEAQVRGMGDEVKNLILGMNPYRGKSNSLWRLHKLNNINKHRYLLAVVANSPGASAWGEALNDMVLSFEPLEEGAIVARFPPDTESHQDVNFSFDVALHETEADTYMWPLMVALRVFSETVTDTVARLDSYR